LTVHDHTPAALTVERAREAQLLLSNKTVLGRAEIEQLPKLRYIGLLSTGYNVVDLEAARERGIPVTNIPSYSTAGVAQLVFALLLEFCFQARLHSDSVHAGEWERSRDFCYWKAPLTELAGKTMGIIGYGRIGQQVARIAEAFGMRVLAYDALRGDTLPLDTVLGAADVLTLHCPLTDATQGFLNRETIAKMKRGAILINTSRGPVLNEQDVADALADGRLGGLGADVLSTEPPQSGNPLLRAPHCLLTPHIAWATKEARARLLDIAAENLRAFLSGAPVHVVN
jgi:glycerate dehydrogenase